MLSWRWLQLPSLRIFPACDCCDWQDLLEVILHQLEPNLQPFPLGAWINLEVFQSYRRSGEKTRMWLAKSTFCCSHWGNIMWLNCHGPFGTNQPPAEYQQVIWGTAGEPWWNKDMITELCLNSRSATRWNKIQSLLFSDTRYLFYNNRKPEQ